MTDDVDIMRKTLSEYEDALRMRNMNQELLDQLSGSIFYLLKYSEKYSITLPKKDELVRMLDKADSLIEQISDPTNRRVTGTRINRQGTSTIIRQIYK
ncbi:MAG: hypothetical protein IIA81_03050 [Thaumarchaeota archaeon]|nr:hypothetical protein [Nitrososphaerota archaeon]